MSAKKLTPERLAELRAKWPATFTEVCDHIDAQQAEIDSLAVYVAALRNELINLGFHGLAHHKECQGDEHCTCNRLAVLAGTRAFYD